MWTQCWLEYKDCKDKIAAYREYFADVKVEGFDSAEIAAATEEIAIAKETWEIQSGSKSIKLSKSDDISLGDEGYSISMADASIEVSALTKKGIIYGTFRMLALVRLGKLEKGKKVTETPDNPIRMLDHWDNMDGSIERGYSGNSFFFEDNDIVINDRTKDYARLLASMGINAVAINNVNVKDAACDLINDRFIGKVKVLNDLFCRYGVSLFLCINFAAPIETEINSADPLDERVAEWWKEKTAEVYSKIPNLGGFLVKADSEGRPGPMTYGRAQSDGANMLAAAIEPFGGKIIWRCFVYNCQQDWRDLTIDRAKAGYDYFSTLDGKFAGNVILQIKNGPMDFQVREPVSPLFGGMSKTNQMLEVQIAQEYTGHQIDVCYLIPWFKEILAFKTYLEGAEKSTVADIISGRALPNIKGGMTAVTNTGNDENWTGNDLAAANLYGFGRLAWNMELSAEEIIKEWIALAMPMLDENADSVVESILMESWHTYEDYTSPLGIGWMVQPHDHYGPNVDGYEYDRWGTYHRADWQGLGVERNMSGTGYTQQYRSPNREMYESVESTPEELLLFFHKIPYTYKLKSGKTVIQHIYDTHFRGYENVKSMRKRWESLKDRLPKRVFENVSERFVRQEANAREWCDIVNSYFYRKCGIADEKGRKIY
ncbi:MAG: alpha-glucuronidase [Lachnospiraceae bacterium]|nr:alpha-glucuronidase [Lachnospiraceae bacterium]